MRPVSLFFVAAVIITAVSLLPLTGCGSSPDDQVPIDFTPVQREDWAVSTPEAEGLSPDVIAEAYRNAAELDTIYSLLVAKNGKLIAEQYFNAGSIEQLSRRASVTKSYVSAMVGIALDRGFIGDIDDTMLDYFPDVAGDITDPRKWQITIRQLLKMRSGYPWEESDSTLWEAIWTGEYLSDIEGFPLKADPGTKFQYSNLTPHWLGIIVARTSGKDLMTFGNEYLFGPLGATPGEDWNRDVDGYYIGGGDIIFSARDMARFGQLYLDEGRYHDEQLVPADWVRDSLKSYSVNEAFVKSVGKFKDIGYGYLWWSARVGDLYVNFAWGHGGQLIVLVEDYDMVIVTTADPFYGKDAHFDSWSHEKAIMETVAELIYDLQK